MNPKISFALREGKNEPCPQSWEMINTRTRNPAARRASGSASNHETFKLRYIKYHSAAYGTSVFVTCHSPGHTAAFWYLATARFHAGVLGLSSPLAEAESFVIM